MKISNKVFVSTPFKTNPKLPIDFPWLTFGESKGVMLTLQGDMGNVHNLQKELGEVKKIVNRDASKHNIRLRDLDIQIQFVHAGAEELK